jgi:uncharacterized iron-regulated membrane protein
MSFIDTPRQSPARRWLFLTHLWIGLVLGPVIGVVALSGAVVVFRYEINRMTTPGTAYVQPHGGRLPADRLVAAVQAARPGDRIQQAAWEAGPDTAWNFRATSPEGHRIHTFIDQYSGVVTGRDDYQGKFMQWVFDLHAYLLAGKTGEFINGFFGLALAVTGLTGLVVWWPGAGHWRFGFSYLWASRWPRQTYDLHKLVGFYTSLALVVVALSGCYFAFPGVYRRIAASLTGTAVRTDGPKASTTWADRRVPMEQYIEVAERTQPGARAISLGFPQKPGDAVSVRLKEARDWHRIGLNYVYLEPANARVLRSDRFAEASAGTQLIQLMYPIHFGRFGGRWGPGAFYAVMVAYVLLGLAPVVLMVTGSLMYWNRSWSKKWRRRGTQKPDGVNPRERTTRT